MKIQQWYSENFETRLRGRYITNDSVIPIMKVYESKFEISIIGTSEEEKPIHLIRVGSGKKVVLGWSQMHGNESTTTKALFDFLKFIHQKSYFQDEINQFLNEFTFYFIPILNPDGAFRYTRLNANEVDLNRDAVNLSQQESRVLRKTFEQLQPQICLNLHGQRTIYGLNNGKSATISFLAPAADQERSVTSSRGVAMDMIERMTSVLSSIIPGQVGRYDDTFNANCVGDTFQSLGSPTILFEAGHFDQDYDREYTRELIFYSFLTLFDFKITEKNNLKPVDYFQIPENQTNFKDLIIRNALVGNESNPVDLGIQFEEELEKGKIRFVPKLEIIDNSIPFFGHREVDVFGAEILVNSHENVFVDDIISTIFVKKGNSPIFFSE